MTCRKGIDYVMKNSRCGNMGDPSAASHIPCGYKENRYVNETLEKLLYSHKEPFWHGGDAGRMAGISGKNRVQCVFGKVVRVLNTL